MHSGAESLIKPNKVSNKATKVSAGAAVVSKFDWVDSLLISLMQLWQVSDTS